MRIKINHFLNSLNGAPEWMLTGSLRRRKEEALELKQAQRGSVVAPFVASVCMASFILLSTAIAFGIDPFDLGAARAIRILLGSTVVGYLVMVLAFPLTRPRRTIDFHGEEAGVFHAIEALLSGPLSGAKLTGDRRADTKICAKLLDQAIESIRQDRARGRLYDTELGKLEDFHRLLQRVTATCRTWEQVRDQALSVGRPVRRS